MNTKPGSAATKPGAASQPPCPRPFHFHVSVQHLSRLFPQLPFNWSPSFFAMLPLSGFFLISYHHPDLEVSPSLPLLSSSPPLPCFSGLHLFRLGHLCMASPPLHHLHTFTRTSHSPCWILCHLSTPQHQSLPQSSTHRCGSSLQPVEDHCEEKRGVRASSLRPRELRDTPPLTGPHPHPIPSQWNLVSQEKVGPCSTAPPLLVSLPFSHTGPVPRPQQYQAPHQLWHCPSYPFAWNALLSFPLSPAKFSSALKSSIPPPPWRSCTCPSPCPGVYTLSTLQLISWQSLHHLADRIVSLPVNRGFSARW